MRYTSDEVRCLKEVALGNVTFDPFNLPRCLRGTIRDMVGRFVETFEDIQVLAETRRKRIDFYQDRLLEIQVNCQQAEKVWKEKQTHWRNMAIALEDRCMAAEARLTAIKAYQMATKEILDEVS
jgi:hypothetical protein